MIHVQLSPEGERMTVAELVRYAHRLQAAQLPADAPVWPWSGGLTTEPPATSDSRHDWHALAPGYSECRNCGKGRDDQDDDVSPVCRPDRPGVGA